MYLWLPIIIPAGQSSSAYKDCFSGVPQGSVHSPLLFSVYVSPIGCIASDHGISLQQYADYTQLHISVSTDDLTVQLSSLESCLHSLHSWLCHNGLALNSSKSESILLGTSSCICNFPPVSDVAIAGSIMPVSDCIVTLGATLDSNLSFRHHVSKVCSTAHFHLRAQRHIQAALLMTWLKQWLFHLFTLASTMLTLSFTDPWFINVRRLQCVQNSAAMMVLRDCPYQSTTALLFELNWFLFSPESHLR